LKTPPRKDFQKRSSKSRGDWCHGGTRRLRSCSL